MLSLLDASLEAFLREAVPLDANDVDVSFEAPDEEWGAGLGRPTVSLHLWDVRRNVEGRHAGLEVTEEDGRRVRQQPLPRIDCRYLVTAWTTEVADEHALLGQILTTVLTTGELPVEVLAGPYAEVRPVPALTLSSHDGTTVSELWSALAGQPRAGLDLVVTATVDAATAIPVGPPVERYDLRLRDTTQEDGGPVDVRSVTEDGPDRATA